MKLPTRAGRTRYLVLLLPHLGLLATWDLATNLPATLLWFALGLAVMAWARRWRPVPSLHVVLLIAAGLRLFMLPLPPTLSDDVFRYIWDGRVAGAGFNPYELSPDAPELVTMRDDLWKTLPHRDVATVYPPLALTLFSIAARFPWPILLWKLVLIAADLTACVFLFKIAALRNGDGSAAIWYAWNPLATLEIAAMGHVDALGVCAVVVAVWALIARRGTATVAAAAAAGVLVKIVPLVAYPVWLRFSPRRWLFAGVSALALGAAFGPVVAASGGVPGGYLRFGGSWEFNGPLYEPLWRGLEEADSRGYVGRALDRQKTRTGDHQFWNRFYPHNHSRTHARLLLAGVFLVLVILAWRQPDVIVATGSVFEVVLLCSATVYPWYLLWLLPFAAIRGHLAWLVLCCSAFLSYIPQFTEIPLLPWVFLACWGPYAVARGLERRWFAA
ncbi:MAG: hypothetical protein GY769_08970 [bacterium]|nr:hypothetical protein [bacterium]